MILGIFPALLITGTLPGAPREEKPPRKKDRPNNAPDKKPSSSKNKIHVRAPARRKIARSPSGSVSIIKLSDTENRARDLSELLDAEAGLRTRRYGGLGSYSTLSIRGSTASQVRFYLDGIPLHHAAQGEVNLADLNIDGLDRLEIYRSGTPSSLGGQAAGGTVNLVTLKDRLGSGGGSRITGGSYGAAKLSGLLWDSQKTRRWLVSASLGRADNDFLFRNDNGTPLLNPLDDRDERRKNSWAKHLGMTAAGSLRRGKTEVRALNDFSYRHRGVPGPSSRQTEKTELFRLRNTSGILTDSRGIFLDYFRLKSRLYYSEIQDRFFDPEQEFSYGAPNSRSRLQSHGLHLMPQLYLLEYHQVLRFFLGAAREIYHRDKRDRFDEFINRLPTRFRSHTSIRIEDEIRLFNKRLILTLGAGYERYRDRLNDPEVAFPELNLKPRASRLTEFPNYSFGVLGYFIKTRRWKVFLKANVSRSGRMPTFLELFGERGSVVGNSDLRPERARQAEIGPGLHLKRKDGTRLKISLVGFRKIVRDMILFTPNSQLTLRPENLDAARVTGLEFSLSLRWKKKLKLSANYTYQRAINESESPAERGRYLPLQPLHEFHTKFAFLHKKWDAGASADFVGAVFKDRANERNAYQEARWIHGVFFTWKFYSRYKKPRKKYKNYREELTLTLEIKNLRNRRLEDVVGYPLPGRAAYLNLKWRF